MIGLDSKDTARLLTIGQLADYAGATIKAIRHYHQRGLLDEPPRDASGYRRYGVEHAIALVKIRTLAEAGVPLARVKELLADDPEQFAASIAEIDCRLAERIDALRQTRERLGRLRGGDRLSVSADVADYLERLRESGVSRRGVALERDLWVLLESAAPQAAADWLAEKRLALDDPEFRAIYLACDAAFDWSADDPRLPPLAARLARWGAERRRAGGATPSKAPPIAHLITSSAAGASPAWLRLATLAADHAGGAPRAAGAPTG